MVLLNKIVKIHNVNNRANVHYALQQRPVGQWPDDYLYILLRDLIFF